MFHLSTIQQTELIRTCCEQRLHNSSADFGVIQEALAGCCSWKSSDINVVLHAKWYAVQCAPQLLRQSLQLPADHTCKVRLHFILPSSSRNAISGHSDIHPHSKRMHATLQHRSREIWAIARAKLSTPAMVLELSGRAPCTSQ